MPLFCWSILGFNDLNTTRIKSRKKMQYFFSQLRKQHVMSWSNVIETIEFWVTGRGRLWLSLLNVPVFLGNKQGYSDTIDDEWRLAARSVQGGRIAVPAHSVHAWGHSHAISCLRVDARTAACNPCSHSSAASLTLDNIFHEYAITLAQRFIVALKQVMTGICFYV